MRLREVTITDFEIDLANIETDEQGEIFQELLEVAPDKELAQRFKLYASQDLLDMLKDHFMENCGLIEDNGVEAPESPQ